MALATIFWRFRLGRLSATPCPPRGAETRHQNPASGRAGGRIVPQRKRKRARAVSSRAFKRRKARDGRKLCGGNAWKRVGGSTPVGALKASIWGESRLGDVRSRERASLGSPRRAGAAQGSTLEDFGGTLCEEAGLRGAKLIPVRDSNLPETISTGFLASIGVTKVRPSPSPELG